MHPLLGNRSALLFALAVWLAAGAGFGALLALAGIVSWKLGLALALPLFLVYGFVCLSPWNICRSLPLDEGMPLRYILVYTGSALGSAAIWLGMGGVWSYALGEMFGAVGAVDAYRAALPAWGGTGALLYIGSIVAHYLLLSMRAARETGQRALELGMQAREAELRALRSQVNPHFLFNSLNSISALTTRDAAAAREMCLLLAEYFRGSLAAGGRETLPLREELALLDEFLAIERARFGERLRVERVIDPAALDCAVPALLLQPLAENAVKHGIAHLVDGGVIAVSITRTGGTLRIEIRNDVDPEAVPRRGTGLGHAIIRNRLRLLYGGGAHFDTRVGDTSYIARISLPCPEAAA